MKTRDLLPIFFTVTIYSVSVLAANVEIPQGKKPQSKLTFEDNYFSEPTRTIVNSIDIMVPGDTKFFPKKINTIQDALNAIKNYKIADGVIVTIKPEENIADYNGIKVTHPDRDKIRVISDCIDDKEKTCAIRFGSGLLWNDMSLDGQKPFDLNCDYRVWFTCPSDPASGTFIQYPISMGSEGMSFKSSGSGILYNLYASDKHYANQVVDGNGAKVTASKAYITYKIQRRCPMYVEEIGKNSQN